jgi:hypothetical protein
MNKFLGSQYNIDNYNQSTEGFSHENTGFMN